MSRGPQEAGRVRIIGGHWRGRKLAVAPQPDLRPSPDRVRETVFNWLAAWLPGAACLDLFAGTGVLGFEALSRGAGSATLVERDPEIAALLDEHRTALGATDATVVKADALRWLKTAPPRQYDIVFIDPPFGRDLVAQSLGCLRAGWLKPHARVYLEAEKIPILDPATDGWRVIREGRTRHVEYALAQIADH